jgi:hypothetical protein
VVFIVEREFFALVKSVFNAGSLIAALLGLYVVPYPVQNEIKSSKFATFFA